MALGFVAVSVAVRMVLWESASFLGEKSLVRNFLVGAVMLGLVVAATVFVQRRSRAIERPGLILIPTATFATARLALIGLLAGSAIFAIVFATVLATGGLEIAWRPVEPLTFLGTLAAGLFATILNAAWEEYTFRGWAFSVCAKAIGPHAIAIGLGAAFGLAHLFNPHPTVAAIVSVALAGFLLSYAMLVSRNILLPIGLHVGWNFTQSLLTSPRFWESTTSADPWLSGGEWGLEASLAGIIVTTLGAAIAFAAFLRFERRSV
ncbi:MAG: CPBP family intramembrane metalloprotease [Deltaproteobacteria bacterium]|nr:CPBP family intramembrane metalloprotease [Deltaproteobacteria bacterium]